MWQVALDGVVRVHSPVQLAAASPGWQSVSPAAGPPGAAPGAPPANPAVLLLCLPPLLSVLFPGASEGGKGCYWVLGAVIVLLEAC